jgi:hypothetical protein
VQILEASMLGLRTARLVFRSRTLPDTVTLYPMVHVGEEAFYRESYAEAFEHDVALVEGVRSPVGRHLTRSYRWIELARLGLVLQPKAPPPETVRARIVRADLSTDEFHREWRKVSVAMRALCYLFAPLIGLHRRSFASRERLIRKQSLEDRRSAEEILNWSPRFEPFTHSILHARDQRLIECLGAELEGCAGQGKRIAIIYGAMHMRAVLRELGRRGFYCVEASWRTIISL